MRARLLSTVLGLMKRAAATSRLVIPAAANSATLRSTALSPSAICGPTFTLANSSRRGPSKEGSRALQNQPEPRAMSLRQRPSHVDDVESALVATAFALVRKASLDGRARSSPAGPPQ